MTSERRWIALVSFERREEGEGLLPEWAQRACGWMVALAPDAETAQRRLVRDNFRYIEDGKQTVWGTLHCYRGEGEA